MSKKYDHFQDHLEWEILESDQEITHLIFETGLYNLSKDCIIKFSRNNQFDLHATISGIIENREQLEPNIEKVKGTFITEETVTGFSKDGLFKYILSGIALGASTSTYISASNPSVKFQADLMVSKIEKIFVGYETTVENIQEWYLTGKTGINFPRSTMRSVDKSFKRLRSGIDPEEDFSLVKSRGSGNDHLIVKFSDTSFIVSKVPLQYGPDWSFSIAIEYRLSFGRIPNEEEREAISELVSFVFGNQLLKIGQTSYDASSSLSVQEYQHPWGDNVVSRCQRQGFPPVEIGDFHDWGRAEILLNELIANYLIKRKPLKLKDTLWKYWLAMYSSLGANLPILSSAVETLADQVLKNHPEIKHYYIEYNQFSELIKEDIISINKKLATAVNVSYSKEKQEAIKGSILSKIKGASQRGSNEKLEMMFEIINLPIDKIERKAIKARNKMAHSSLGDISDEEVKETIRLTRAYETLFNRIFLKILSYKGSYRDYYTFGHPDRNIDEPIPEEK
jgi:hypothetical protein